MALASGVESSEQLLLMWEDNYPRGNGSARLIMSCCTWRLRLCTQCFRNYWGLKEMATHSSTLAWKKRMDGGAWQATVHGVAKSWTWLSDFTFIEKYYLLNVIYYLWFLEWCSKITKVFLKRWPIRGGWIISFVRSKDLICLWSVRKTIVCCT